MPHKGGGRTGKAVAIDLAEAVNWEIEQAKTEAQAPVQTERARLQREQADRIALENALRRGELVKTADIAAMIRKAGVILRAELDGMSGRLAGELAGMSEVPEIRSRLLGECRRVQQAFSNACGVEATAAERRPNS